MYTCVCVYVYNMFRKIHPISGVSRYSKINSCLIYSISVYQHTASNKRCIFITHCSGVRLIYCLSASSLCRVQDNEIYAKIY